MHTGTLRKCALLLTFWLALHVAALKAQTFTAPLQASTTGTNPVDFEFRANGILIAKGDFGVGSLVAGDQGAGTRVLWFPNLSAFRAGTVDSTQWNLSNLGTYSTAFGFDTTASGTYSTASGYKTVASGNSSLAGGVQATSSGIAAVALGSNSTASGAYSTALNNGTTASGNYSLATGFITTASGATSTAVGSVTGASGNNSLAAGAATSASSYDSFVIGAANVGGGSATSWVDTDPLFEIGNGNQWGLGNPSASSTSDALVVYKNGNAALQGTLQVAPSGDIPMYTGE